MTDTSPRTRYVETAALPLDALTPFPGNARRGRVAVIAASLAEHGQYRSLVVRRTADGAHVVLAGNHTLLALRENGAEVARCEVVECDDATARKINLVDNKAADDGEYDAEALRLLLGDLGGDWSGTGYDEHDLTSLLTSGSEDRWAEERAEELGGPLGTPLAGAEGVPEKDKTRWSVRTLPIDAIVSMQAGPQTWAAYQMGFGIGMISSSPEGARKHCEIHRGLRIRFMDNEWHGYDHAAHVEAVKEFHPVYTTVRDVMTRAQCQAAGVEFYPLEQILEWAQELEEHADHVIVIPKYDCLDKIPEQYVIGFSVPSSYGGTPLPASMLRGRRVHLLGGAWKNQLRYLALLGDDVVSFDNNHLLKIAKFGSFYLPGGREANFGVIYQDLYGPWQAASCLSLATIRDDLHRHFGTGLVSPADDPDEIPAIMTHQIEDEEDER